jgi:putative protease
MIDALVKTQRMAKQKFRPTRPGVFSGAKAYIRYVEVLKKRRNAVGRNFCDAIMIEIQGKSL